MFNFSKFKALFKPGALPPYERAVVALEGGDYAEALGRFDALLAEDVLTMGERAKVVNKRGIALLRMGRREEALRAFESALTLAPRYAPALVNIGNLCLEEGSVGDAIAHYEKAIRADDGYSVAHLNLGIAFKRLGRTADSVRELKMASRLERRRRS